jgi:hypothetical protein
MKRTTPVLGRVPTPEEQIGKTALYRYFREYHGCQAKMSRDTGIHVGVLSKMASYPEYVITLDAAMMIEVATNGELRADVLCPSRADTLAQFLVIRTREAEAA